MFLVDVFCLDKVCLESRIVEFGECGLLGSIKIKSVFERKLIIQRLLLIARVMFVMENIG
jgi:hypothetical protein